MSARGNTGSAPKIRLGELLVKAGVITDSQLRTALAEQRQWGGRLGDILVRMRYLSEDVFVRALSKQLGIPRADLSGSLPVEALAKIPAQVAEEYEIVPIAIVDEGKTIVVATADPLNITVSDYVRSLTKLRVVMYVAGASAIRGAIARLYQSEELRVSDPGPMQILANSEDQVPPSPPAAAAPPAPPYSISATSPTMPAIRLNNQPTPMPQSMQPPMQAPMQLQGQPMVPMHPGIAPMGVPPGFGYGYAPGQPPFAMPGPAAQGPDRVSVVEEAQRRENAALKALVELLVQKGVISLDEYLARLKR